MIKNEEKGRVKMRKGEGMKGGERKERRKKRW